MGMADRAEIARRLVNAGRPPDTPVVVVHRGTSSTQASVRTTLAGLAGVDLGPPCTIVIGPVAALDLRSSERGPLTGTRVVVTRARAQASELVARPARRGCGGDRAPGDRHRRSARRRLGTARRGGPCRHLRLDRLHVVQRRRTLLEPAARCTRARRCAPGGGGSGHGPFARRTPCRRRPGPRRGVRRRAGVRHAWRPIRRVSHRAGPVPESRGGPRRGGPRAPQQGLGGDRGRRLPNSVGSRQQERRRRRARHRVGRGRHHLHLSVHGDAITPSSPGTAVRRRSWRASGR